MVTNDYLVTHALENLWCAPDQDNQYIVKPKRITPNGGVINNYTFLWNRVTLPNAFSRFHLYQIGQIHPTLLDLVEQEGQWVAFSKVTNESSTYIDLYDVSGIHVPLCQTWYMVTKERALLIAVIQHSSTLLDFDNVQLYLRVYDNAFFASQRAAALTDQLETSGKLIVRNDDIIELQTACDKRVNDPGAVLCFVNGIWVNQISLITANVGDVAEYVHDQSIVRAVDFKLSSLTTFESTLDNKRKYLLHYIGGSNDVVNYVDDLDLYLVSKKNQKGYYIHRNTEDALRMVTYRDYSIPVEYVRAYVELFRDEQNKIDYDDLYFRLYLRNSGQNRPLVKEAARLEQLYHLPEKQLVEVLGGVNSNIGVWRADALEASAYCELMRTDAHLVTADLVEKAYGYNAIAKLIGQSIHKVNLSDPARNIAIPLAYRRNCTAFEYDQAGLLLNWYTLSNASVYHVKTLETGYVEFVYGHAGMILDEYVDQQGVSLSPTNRYRFYAIENERWQDVGATSLYEIRDGEVFWAQAVPSSTLIRSDAVFLCYELNLRFSEGLLSFHIAQQSDDGTATADDLEVPMGELFVFLNGRSLIEGLDYLVSFPHVMILNKRFLTNSDSGDLEKIIVRFTGFCESNMERSQKAEFGFMRQGEVSDTQPFALTKSQVTRITCSGRLNVDSELIFDDAGLPVSATASGNGKPYQLREIVVPLNAVSDSDNYALRAKSVEIDNEVRDYLNAHVIAQTYAVNPIEDKYPVISPFFSALTDGLLNNRIAPNELSAPYDNEAMRRWCAPYLYLLETDLINKRYPFQAGYVSIHPHRFNHSIHLTVSQYRFLNNAWRLYGNDRIALQGFYIINPDTIN